MGRQDCSSSVGEVRFNLFLNIVFSDISFLDVQQSSSIGDLVTQSVSDVLISADYNDYNDYNNYNDCNDYNRDSNLNLD